jgi:hypothetical protein
MRALRQKPKLPPEPQQESDEESDFEATPRNNFSLLQTDSSTESEQEDEQEHDTLPVVQVPKASSGKSKASREEQDDTNWEKLLSDFKQDQSVVEDQEEIVSLKQILGVNAMYLDPQLELKKMFGSVVVEEKAKKKGRRTRPIVKDGLLVKFKDTWPRMTKLGLSMEVIRVEGGDL